MLPNDEDEKSRLQDLQNYFKAQFGANILAPLPLNPSLIGTASPTYLILIVDVGTGAGFWCMEVAREYPTAQVVGTDLSPMQSTNTPENCKFLVESLMDGLSFETGSVDYLQSRYDLIEKLILGRCWEEYRLLPGRDILQRYSEF
jgi:trans-aconitate methyltransferase